MAASCTAVFLPLHVWHLRFGFRGLTPPHGVWTLAGIALAQAVGLTVVGPSWTLMLASFASSALIVLNIRSAAIVCAAVLAVAFISVEASASAASDGRPGIYFAMSLVFRSVTLFVTVWFAAAAHQLESARSSIAARSADGERNRARQELAALTQVSGRAVLEHVRDAETLRATGQQAAAARRLGDLAELARETLARVRELARMLRTHAGALEHRRDTLTQSGPDSPVERLLVDAGRSRRVLVLAHAPPIVFFLSIAATGLGQPGFPTVPIGVVLTAGAALVAVQLSVSLAVSAQRRPRHPAVVLAGVWTLGLVPAAVFGSGWGLAAWFVSAVGALTPRRRSAGVVGFLAPIALFTANEVRLGSHVDARWWELLWIGGYVATVGTVGAAGMVCAARLTPVVEGLIGLRRAEAAQVREAERWRISRDLHDLLGQTLSALSLKAELARRQLAFDPDAACREMQDIGDLAQSLTEQLHTVADAVRQPTLAEELRAGTILLRQSGTQVDVRLDPPPADLDGLLGWAVREGITNVLRHSRASRCSITVAEADATVLLEIVNDGSPPKNDHPTGQGLTNLRERFDAVGGSLKVSSEDGWFRMSAVAPGPCVSPTPRESQ